jgi:hypothetical protein
LQPQAPVLLAVDELSKYGDGKYGPESLKILTNYLDVTNVAAAGSFFLSVTGYGLFDICSLATNSNRPLSLQPLPPIFPFHPVANFPQLLPPLLRPFASPEERQKLAYDKTSFVFYGTLAKLLTETGGHPRRVNACLHALWRLCGDSAMMYEASNVGQLNKIRSDYMQKLCGTHQDTSCSAEEISREMNGILNLRVAGATLVGFVTDADCAVRDIIVPYCFPQDKDDAQTHDAMLRGSMKGACQFTEKNSREGWTFFPLPSFRSFSSGLNERHESPVVQAACIAADAISKYLDAINVTDGKRFERVVASLLLLLCRCQLTFTLRSLCRMVGRGTAASVADVEAKESIWDCKLRGGSEIPFVEARSNQPLDKVDVPRFPSSFEGEPFQLHCADLNAFLERYPNGAVVIPADKYNLASDVVCLFRVCGSQSFVLLSVQCKDWFNDFIRKHGKQVHVMDEFRWAQQFYTCDTVFTSQFTDDGNTQLPNSFASQLRQQPHVRVAHLLFTANPVTSAWTGFPLGMNAPSHAELHDPALREDEARTDWEHCINVCPTMAYAVTSGHKMRQWFSKPAID